MKNFVTTEWLAKHLDDKNMVVVDCRSDLIDLNYGRDVYNKGHIKGAVFVDLKKELCEPVKEHGGRSPLPSLDKIKSVVERLGISNDTLVVAYDDFKITGASRFCWMLRYIGHNKNYILEGSINKWISEGYELSKDNVEPKSAKFNIDLKENMITYVNYVNNHKKDEDILLIDSRANERYKGEVEPVDKIAGHIPGAVNIHWKDNLKENGSLKDLNNIKERFREATNRKETIVYCGSGIDATYNFMLLDEIGIKAKLYAGSWSDWITYPENEIAKDEE